MTDVSKSQDELTALYRKLKENFLKANETEATPKFLEMVSGWSDPPSLDDLLLTRDQASFTNECSDFIIAALDAAIYITPVPTDRISDQIYRVVTCPRCGSPEVSADAAARWNIETQAWEMSTTFDNRTCDTCSYEGFYFFNTPLSDLTPNQKAFLDGEVEDYEIPPEVNL